jgi:hypothetical protein
MVLPTPGGAPAAHGAVVALRARERGPRHDAHRAVEATHGSQFERPARLELPDDVGQVHRASRTPTRRHPLRDRQLGAQPGDGIPPDQLGERVGGVHADAVDELCLGEVVPRHDDIGDPGTRGGQDHRQDAAHPTDATIETQLAQVNGGVRHVGADRAGRHEHRHGDGQIEGSAPLGNRRRGQVDHDPVRRDRGPTRGGRGADPVRGLTAGLVGQSRDGEVGQAGADVGLDVDDRAGQSVEGDGQGAAQGHDSTPLM